MKNKLSGLASLGGLVYSTESGRMCPDCRHPVAQCTGKAQAALPQGDGVVRVSRETKGRGGKAGLCRAHYWRHALGKTHVRWVLGAQGPGQRGADRFA